MATVPANQAEMRDDSIRVRKRRRIVALPRNQNKPHRALARELKVSEGTIRRDRRMLLHPELDGCNLRAKPVPPRVIAPYDWNSPNHLKRMLKAANSWTWHQGLRPADWRGIARWIENCLLHPCSGEPPTVDPESAFEIVKPKDFDPNKMHAYAVWLMSWLDYCLPGKRNVQQQMLEAIGERVNERRYPERVQMPAQIRGPIYW